jgi:hypothetical protein
MAKVVSLFNDKNQYQPRNVNPINEEEEKRNRGKDIFEASKPADAVAVIIASLEEKDYNSGTDSQGSITKQKLILGWSSRTRKSFSELRKAAAAYEPTRFFTEGDYKVYEHRDRYPTGGGDYLAVERHSGWQVYKLEIDGNLEKLYPMAADSADILVAQDPVEQEAATTPKDVKRTSLRPEVKRNRRTKEVEMSFSKKLDLASHLQLVDLGWKYSVFHRLYHISFSEDALSFAKSYVGKPEIRDASAGMIDPNDAAYLDSICHKNRRK